MTTKVRFRKVVLVEGRRLDCDISKNISRSILSYPLRILKTSIKSPLNLRVSS